MTHLDSIIQSLVGSIEEPVGISIDGNNDGILDESFGWTLITEIWLIDLNGVDSTELREPIIRPTSNCVFFSLFSPFPFHPIRSLKKCFLLKTFYDFVELKGNLIGDTLNYFVSAMVLLNGK